MESFSNTGRASGHIPFSDMNSHIISKYSSGYMDGNSTVGFRYNASSEKYSSEYIHLQEATDIIGRYSIWIIFAIGFPENLISLYIIVRMSHQRLMSPLFYVFLTCFGLLAVVDNTAIILKIIENQLRNNHVFMNAPACKLLHFWGLTLVAYPNWILIVMSAIWFTAVKFPKILDRVWSLKRTVIVIIIVLLLLCLGHSHMFFSIISEDGSCHEHKAFHSFYSRCWFLISSFVYAIIPAVAVTIFYILTFTVLRKSVSDVHRQERQVTIMMATVAVVFILLTIPRCVFVSLWYYWNPQNSLDKMRKYFLDAFTNALANFNHALNFYQYFVSSKRFRKHFIEIISSKFPCMKRRSR